MKTTEGKMFLKEYSYHCLDTQGGEQVEDKGVCGGIYRYDLMVKEKINIVTETMIRINFIDISLL